MGLQFYAAAMIFSHNQASGNPEPSKVDPTLTPNGNILLVKTRDAANAIILLLAIVPQRSILNLYSPGKRCFGIARPMAVASCWPITQGDKPVSGEHHGIVSERDMAGQVV